MREFEEKLKIVIDKMVSLLESEATVRNAELIKICRKSGLNLIAQKQGTHLIHEVFETAINAQIYKKYRLSKFDDKDTNLQNLRELSDLLKKIPPQSWRGEDQIRMQQFSTPPTIAFLMARVLNPQKDELILEPSAGTGSLAIWLKLAGCRYYLNELSETRRILLKLQGFASNSYNAEFLDDLLPEEILPDGILMNPPFSANAGRTKSGDSNFGFRHITSALNRLKKGGRLVALFGSETLMKTRKGQKFLTEMSDIYDLGAVINLPRNSYYKYGTTLPVSILCISKREPQKSLNEVLILDCTNLEEILSINGIFD
jgi:type I restriction-modification system DNA methylase subunit